MSSHRVLRHARSDSDSTRSSLLCRLRDWDDQGGWQEFFDTYCKLIYSVAIKAGLSDAEAHDVVQETVVAVARQMRDRGFDRQRSSFKNWLFLITRRRIIDHLRVRKPDDPAIRNVGNPQTDTGTAPLHRIPDPTCADLDSIWAEEWRKNLVDVAIERIKTQVGTKHFQIFQENSPLAARDPAREGGKYTRHSYHRQQASRSRLGDARLRMRSCAPSPSIQSEKNRERTHPRRQGDRRHPAHADPGARPP